MGVSFGSYDGICDTVALIVCPLLGGPMGLEPSCYSRNVEINSTVIFQPGKLRRLPGLTHGSRRLSSATCVIHIAALVMTAVMVYHIRSKYTAVGKYRLRDIAAVLLS